MRQAVQALNGAVRPVVAFSLAAALIFLSVRGDVAAAEFVPIVTFVLGYWFRARDSETNSPPSPPRG